MGALQYRGNESKGEDLARKGILRVGGLSLVQCPTFNNGSARRKENESDVDVVPLDRCRSKLKTLHLLQDLLTATILLATH